MSPLAVRPLLAFVALVAASAALLALPAPPSRAALPTEEVNFESGSVEWGFANRWRCYVVGMISRGEIEVSEGASKVPGTEAEGSMCNLDPSGSEVISFPVDNGYWDPVTGEGFLQLRGKVRFWGHAWHTPGDTTPQLDTTFTDLMVWIEEGTGTLTADVTGATQENPEPMDYDDLSIADIDFSGITPTDRPDGLDWSAVPTSLSEDGTQAFGSYPAGEPFDDLVLSPDFQPEGPGPDPDPEPQPEAKPAQIKRIASTRSNRAGLAAIAAVRCPGAGPVCEVGHRKRAAVKAAGRSFTAPVVAPKRVAAGSAGRVQVRLPARVKKLIRGRADARVSLQISVERDGRTVSRQVSTRVRS